MEYINLFKDYKKYSKINEDDIHEYIELNNISEEDGMHIWFGMIVIPLILKLINRNDKERLKLSFTFFEKMASSSDSDITEVLEFTILENLLTQSEEIRNKCYEYMGPETLKSCNNVKKYIIG